MQKISVDEWREIFALLDTAHAMSAADRPAWLGSLQPRSRVVIDTLHDLLARPTTDGFLEQLPQFTCSPDGSTNDLPGSPQAGGTVGPYRLIEKLGRGGMSSVWIAERIDGSPKRRVALKLPHIGGALPDVARRVERERDLLGSLEHPGIARLYDAGMSADGQPYLALELVEGVPIDVYCQAGSISIESRVSLVLQVARAVDYAHSRSIVHRDLKPANVLVDAAGQVHLLDFGIGKLLAADTAASADTQFAARLFTPDYASPEQLRGEAVTAACDVFSLGIVLYQLISGTLPFAARTAHTNENDRSADARPPSLASSSAATRQALRGDLDTIVLKALKHVPEQRYSSMRVFVQDLEHYLRGEPVQARPDSAWYRLRKRARRNRRTLAAVAVTLAVAVVAGIAVYLRQSKAHDAATETIARRSVPEDAPRDLTAYHEYLRARSLMLRPTEDNLREILRLAQSATTRDPEYAHAHALRSGAQVLFLDLGYPMPGALEQAEPIARRALELAPRLPGAHATLGSITAHRGQWLEAEAHFSRAFAFNDGTGRIRARHAQTVLTSLGRLDEALREYQSEFRLAPAHARGAMQVAQALAMKTGHDDEATQYLEIALSLGWPAEEPDVREFLARKARRSGRHADAINYQVLALPAAIRALKGEALVPLLQAALDSGAGVGRALESLDNLDSGLRAADTHSFASLMFLMNWYAMLGDLDRAYAAGDRWVAMSQATGRSGIPHNAGFWLDEMRAFRADSRFAGIATRLGMVEHWRRHGAPDGCRLAARITCDASP